MKRAVLMAVLVSLPAAIGLGACATSPAIESGTAEVNGVTLPYEVTGEGAPRRRSC